MSTLTNKFIKATGATLAVISLFTLGSCSLFNKSLTKEEALKECSTVSKAYGDILDTEDTLEAMYKFPVKKLEYVEKTTVKQKGVDEITETINSTKVTKSGKKENLKLDLVTNNNGEKESGSYFVKDDKYYLDKDGITEIKDDDFNLVALFTYLLPVFDISSSNPNNIIGTSDIEEGFTSATKGISDIVINAEVDYSRTKVTLKKAGLFKSNYWLSEYAKSDRKVEEDTTTTTLTTLKLSY